MKDLVDEFQRAAHRCVAGVEPHAPLEAAHFSGPEPRQRQKAHDENDQPLKWAETAGDGRGR